MAGNAVTGIVTFVSHFQQVVVRESGVLFAWEEIFANGTRVVKSDGDVGSDVMIAETFLILMDSGSILLNDIDGLLMVVAERLL